MTLNASFNWILTGTWLLNLQATSSKATNISYLKTNCSTKGLPPQLLMLSPIKGPPPQKKERKFPRHIVFPYPKMVYVLHLHCYCYCSPSSAPVNHQSRSNSVDLTVISLTSTFLLPLKPPPPLAGMVWYGMVLSISSQIYMLSISTLVNLISRFRLYPPTPTFASSYC